MTIDTVDLESRYLVVDKRTGEEVSLGNVAKKYAEAEMGGVVGGFELTYPDKLMEYIETANSPRTKVLAYLLKVKSTVNTLMVTQGQIVEETDVSGNSVSFIMKELQNRGLIKKVRYGCYIMHPDISVRGGKSRWVAKSNWDKGVVK